MDAAEALKENGNAAFMSGDEATAAKCYEAALALLDSPETKEGLQDSQAYKDLARNLYSNLSNVYLSLQKYDDSCRTASKALELDPAFVKASLRYVKAKMLAGYAFDAFVYALRHTRALVRAQVAGSPAAKDSASALQEVETKLCLALGISKLSAGFELVDFEGGVDMVCRRHYSPGDILFAEEKYKTRLDESSINVASSETAGTTTESIVLHFAEHIRPEQEANSDAWQQFRRDFVGAWPRCVDDVDEFTRRHVGQYLRPHFANVEEDAFQELLLMSLMCRYNCFYTGFFRTCALANHSCNANIAMKYSPATQTVTMVAVKDIYPGELMNVKYLNDAYFLLGVCKRRQLLRAWLFWCRCPRCVEDGDALSAVQEYVRCRHCRQYTHYPIPAPPSEDSEEDPSLTANPTCTRCGNGITWPAEKLQCFYNLPSCSLDDGSSAQEAGRWLVEKLQSACELEVHPAHWIHRVLLYLFCVHLNTAMQHRFRVLMQPMASVAARDDAARDVLQPFGLHAIYADFLARLTADPTCYNASASAPTSNGKAEPTPAGAGHAVLYDPAGIVSDDVLVRTKAATHGSDSLRALCILYRLIEPFYPSAEMWAVHKMISECVLLHLLYQRSLRLPEEHRLSAEQAITLLHDHVPFLGEQASARLLHCFNFLKTSMGAEDERELPSTSSLKKALKAK